jgi:chromosome segregation ATPase
MAHYALMSEPNNTPEGSPESIGSVPGAPHQKIADETRVLQRALADMEKHHAQGVAHLREREGKLRAAAKALEKTESAHQVLLKEHGELLARQKAAQTELELLRTQRDDLQKQIPSLHEEAAQSEARLKQLASLHAGQGEQIQVQEAKLKLLAEQNRELVQKADAAANAETRLLQANLDLNLAETARAALATTISALAKSREEQEQEVLKLGERLIHLQAEEQGAQSQLKDAGAALAEFRAQSDSEKHRLQKELDSILQSLETKERELSQQTSLHIDTTGKLLQTQEKLQLAVADYTKVTTELAGFAEERAAQDRETIAIGERLNAFRAEEQEVISQIKDAHAQHDTFRAESESERQRLQGELEAIFNAADSKYRELEQTTAQLSSTEEKLSSAQVSLQQAEAAHATCAKTIDSLSLQRTKVESEVKALDARLQALKADGLSASAQLEQSKKALDSFTAETAEQKFSLQSELKALKAQLAERQNDLQAAAQQVVKARTEHDELQRQNRLWAGVEQKLAEVTKSIAQSEAQAVQILDNNKMLKQAGDELQCQLAKFRQDEKASRDGLQALRLEEAALQQALKELEAARDSERRRFEAERQNNSEAELAAAARLAGIEAKHERHQRDSIQLEARLYALQSYENDLDKRYARLAMLNEGSPEAMEQWKGLQELKKAIAQELPNKEIQVRPETRVQVVPRKK